VRLDARSVSYAYCRRACRAGTMAGFSSREVVAIVAVMLLSTFASMGAERGKYQVGQVWAYTARLGEEQSTATILKIEKFGKVGDVVHVLSVGYGSANCSGGRGPTTVAHIPMQRSALERSTTKRLNPNVTLPTVTSSGKKTTEVSTRLPCAG
jgi:hypothetical protein